MNGNRTPPWFLLILAWLLSVSVHAQAPDSPSRILSRARALEAEQRYPAALAAYRDYLAARPEDDEARSALARLLSWQGNYEEAAALYEDILGRHPVDLDVRTALARVRSWQQRFAEARRLYQAVLDEAPGHLEAKRGLADTLFWSGRHEEALALYRELLEMGYEPAEMRRRIRQIEMAEAPVSASTEPSLPYRDYLKPGFGFFDYSSGIDEERTGSLEVAKSFNKYTAVARFEALDRFGLSDQQISGEFYSPLWEKSWGYLSASVGIDAEFVADWTLGGEIYQGLALFAPALSPLEASFGYRHMSFPAAEVDILIPGITFYLPNNVWITEKLYYVPDTDASTLLSQLAWRPGKRLQFQFSGAFGTAAERVASLDDVRRTDTVTLQAGAVLPLTSRLSLEAWALYEDRENLYLRRGGMLNLLLHW